MDRLVKLCYLVGMYTILVASHDGYPNMTVAPTVATSPLRKSAYPMATPKPIPNTMMNQNLTQTKTLKPQNSCDGSAWDGGDGGCSIPPNSYPTTTPKTTHSGFSEPYLVRWTIQRESLQ